MIDNPLDTIRRIQATLIEWRDFKLRTGHWPIASVTLAGFLNALLLVGMGFLVWFSNNHGWAKSRLLLVLAGPVIVWVFGGSWLREKVWLTELRGSLKPGFWEIVKNKDGTYDIIHSGELLRRSVISKYLYNELYRYGFRGDDYIDIYNQLDRSGKATIIW
jgi:hypothetical protein